MRNNYHKDFNGAIVALGECVGSTLVAVLSLIEAPHPLHTNISKGLSERDFFFDNDRV